MWTWTFKWPNLAIHTYNEMWLLKCWCAFSVSYPSPIETKEYTDTELMCWYHYKFLMIIVCTYWMVADYISRPMFQVEDMWLKWRVGLHPGLWDWMWFLTINNCDSVISRKYLPFSSLQHPLLQNHLHMLPVFKHHIN